MENNLVQAVMERGVRIPNPESVYISGDVNPERISGDNVTIYAGCKIVGSKSLIMKNCTLGYEAPVTLDNCMVGESCRLDGGFFQGAVFAGGNTFGSGAHVREGTILEEEANAAHTAGLKQTILFPFVTLGSLINFCDCLMAGGTSRKNHSEVGSSFIHFNYTPNQDKATASMMGNVHQGVMLRSKPIFLGGQGGIVGPVKIGFGCVSAAGSVIRRDEPGNDRLLLGGSFKDMSVPVHYRIYQKPAEIFNKSVHYIAALVSLRQWYRHVRSRFVYDDFSKELHKGMMLNLDACIKERIVRLGDFCEKLKTSKENLLKKGRERTSNIILRHEKAIKQFQYAEKIFNRKSADIQLNLEGRLFIETVEKKIDVHSKNYIKTIQSLDREGSEKGSRWLFDIEQSMTEKLTIA